MTAARWTLALLTLLSCAGHAAAQKKGDVNFLVRPPLPAEADSNSAYAYHWLGRQLLTTKPREAERAFHWAIQIDPAMAEAYQGQSIAILARNDGNYARFLQRTFDPRKRPELARADTLLAEARVRDPFLDQQLQIDMIREQDASAFAAVRAAAREEASRQPEAAMALAWLEQNDAAMLAATERALARAPKGQELRLLRGFAFARLGAHVNAIAEFDSVLVSRRRREDTTTVPVYDSKAMLEYIIGRLQLRAGNRAAAREAFARALTDDLGFRYAHVQLAEMAAEDGDAAMALNEYETAITASPGDSWIRYRYALRLMEARRWSDAERELTAVRTAAPLFAAPLLPLARIKESAGDDDAAAALYRTFLAIAPRDATAERALVRTRLETLAPSAP